jgi:hypothetical protein
VCVCVCVCGLCLCVCVCVFVCVCGLCAVGNSSEDCDVIHTVLLSVLTNCTILHFDRRYNSM